MERLGFIDPTRLVICSLPGSKTIRIEAYGLSPKEAKLLTNQFGGKLHKVNTAAVLASQKAERPPLRIRKQLVVVSSEKERTKARHDFPGRKVLAIPAALAFGTGDHATTASCLRLLCDVSARLNNWSMLDLGTGTGILAIAARFLGATKVEATDFDPQAVRVAKENLKTNKADRVKLKRADLLKWEPNTEFDLVAANVFSSVLIQGAPAITKAVSPTGWLILSGILRTQEKECLKAFTKNFDVRQVVHKGKWVSILAQKKGRNSA